MHTIAGEDFFEEAEVAKILNKEISSLRSDAARRRGPPRISEGNCILYRAVALREWLIAHERDFKEMQDRVRNGENKRNGEMYEGPTRK